ncbi:toll/interleukin-1 receptor domain-containing protein [Bradyrhizobium australafricanum]|uniref:toll/interleukin-1 receptor domain-containing protein n=1 Tax=Bradyrhizobium australafricanum TaxID=2821406 RepID=UPI001CE306DB|nr:toll/interleukin-1 receptor domain-containing protein [Bradyrhizobium australafricanum]MCA6105476.1 toll/interleukin-1 receptor domain-containing protein [Bradyrhizobium australafricanum]
MTKPLVFLSHINEEAELAGLFKTEIERVFLGMIEVFLSSEDTTIAVGSRWLDKITEGLRSAQAVMILCSPISIHRPWINFEAGGGWARDITVAPLCHSGLRFVQLPLPLNLLQAVKAHDAEGLGRLFAMLAAKLNATIQAIDATGFTQTGFIQKVVAFEDKYSLEVKALPHLRTIQAAWPELISAIEGASGGPVNVQNVAEWRETAIRLALEALKKDKFLDYADGTTSMTIGGSGSGMTGDLVLAPTSSLTTIVGRRF